MLYNASVPDTVSATDNGGLGWSVASNAGTSDYVVAARHLSATGTATQEGALLGRDEIIVDQVTELVFMASVKSAIHLRAPLNGSGSDTP